GDLLRFSASHIHDPDVSALIGHISDAIGFDQRMFVIQLIVVLFSLGNAVAGANLADHRYLSSVRRPDKFADAILQVGNAMCFAAIHGERVDLGFFHDACFWVTPRRQKREHTTIVVPGRTSRTVASCELPGSAASIRRDHPYFGSP